MSNENLDNLPEENLTFSDIASSFFDNYDLIDWNLWNTVASANAEQTLDQTLTELDTLLEAIKPNGLTPYENLKVQLFGENYTFPTLNELPIPTDTQLAGVNLAIDEHVKSINNDILETFENNPNATSADLDFIGFRVKKENKVYLDVDKLKCYIEMLELLTEANQIQNDDNSKDITKKVLYKCYQFCKM